MIPIWASAGGGFNLEQFVMRGLAVAGATAVGAFGTGLLLAIVRRWLRLSDIPRSVHVLSRLTGGLTLGLAAFLWLFGSGGSGWFQGSGGNSPFGSNGTGHTEPVKPPPDTTPGTGQSIQITMLGGDKVAGESFYLIDDDKSAKSLSEVKQFLREVQDKSKVKSLEILIYDNSVARNHVAVRELEHWAYDSRLPVTVVTVKSELP